ncbi:type II toxin-antitoxin system antitoxin VapB2 [soil metagenome]
MTDVLIRDVPEDDLKRIDEKAARLGLSRNEYLRRQIAQDAARELSTVTRADFERLTDLGRDLLDDDVMRGAWS